MTDSAPAGGRGRAIFAPLAAVIVVGVIAAAILILRSGAGPAGSAKPAPLRLADTGFAAATIAGAGGAEPAANGPAFPGGTPRVQGTLPAGPARGRVLTLSTGPAPRAAVARLAETFGVVGEPRREGAAWVVGGGSRQLMVGDTSGWPWMLTPAPPIAPECPVKNPGMGEVTCAHPVPAQPGGQVPPAEPQAGAGREPATGSTQVGKPADGPVGVPADGQSGIAGTAVPPRPAGPAPSEARVRQAAESLFGQLGLAEADVRVMTHPGGGFAVAAPTVNGLPTVGLDTGLQYDGAVRLVGGNGWLGTTRPGAEYPLVSAAEAMRQLPAWPVVAMPCDARMPNQCRAVELVITGARFGYELRWEQRAGALLVPAWLYDIRGSDMPIAGVAVHPDYLKPAGAGAGVGRGGPPGAGAGQGGAPGVEPAPNPTAEVTHTAQPPIDPTTLPAPASTPLPTSSGTR